MLVELAKALSGEIPLSSRLGQWILLASRLLDVQVQAVDIRYPQIRLDPIDSPPTPASAGPSSGWTFVNGNRVYVESPFNPNRDTSQNIIFGIGWVPTGDEPAATVRWEGIFGFESIGKDVSVTDLTKTVDAAAGGALLYKHSAILITPANLAPFPSADEVHARLQLVTSGNDPVSPPALHHIVVIQALK